MPQKVGIIRERCTAIMRAPKDNRAAVGVQLTKVEPVPSLLRGSETYSHAGFLYSCLEASATKSAYSCMSEVGGGFGWPAILSNSKL